MANMGRKRKITSLNDAELQAGPLAPSTYQEGLGHFDFAVIGAGVAGLAAALSIHVAFNGTPEQRKRLMPKAVSKLLKKKAKAKPQGNPRPVGNGSAIGAGSVQGHSATAASTRRVRVAVFERDVSHAARQQGYGLTLTYNLAGPLAKLGCLEECRARDTASRSHYIFASDGAVLGYFGNAFIKNKGHMYDGQRGNLRIPRQELQELLLQKLSAAGIEVFWGKSLVDVSVPQDETHEAHTAQIPQVALKFADNSECSANCVIGADGIRSRTRRIVEDKIQAHLKRKTLSKMGDDSPTKTARTREQSKNELEQIRLSGSTHLRFIAVGIIIGLSTFEHPLLVERGFYTLDGRQRLFTMPFKVERNASGSVIRRVTMWQLSFPVSPESAQTLFGRSGVRRGRSDAAKQCQVLLKEAQRRTTGWHEPVSSLINASLLDSVWGTALYDSNPSQWAQERQVLRKKLTTGCEEDRPALGLVNYITLVGDAVHAMSPFKGQGANQALADGPLLAQWLFEQFRLGTSKPKPLDAKAISRVVACFEREMSQRSRNKVADSYAAAQRIHDGTYAQSVVKDRFASSEVNTCDKYPEFRIAGVDDHLLPNVLRALAEGGITSALGGDLDRHVLDVIEAEKRKQRS